MGLAEAIQNAIGQPASVRVGTVTSASPLEIGAQGVPFDDVGVLNGYIPRVGDSVVMLGQSSAAGSDPASWMALGPAYPAGAMQTPAVMVQRTTVLSIPSALGVDTFVPWNNEIFDNYDMASLTANFVTVPVNGVYHATVRARITSNAVGIRIGAIYVNGVATNQEDATPAITGIQTSVGLSADLLLNAGDQVGMVVKQNSGGALDLTFAWLSVFLVATA